MGDFFGDGGNHFFGWLVSMEMRLLAAPIDCTSNSRGVLALVSNIKAFRRNILFFLGFFHESLEGISSLRRERELN
jgi:hypothetical protein